MIHTCTLGCSAILTQQHLTYQSLIEGIVQYQADLVSDSKFACVHKTVKIFSVCCFGAKMVQDGNKASFFECEIHIYLQLNNIAKDINGIMFILCYFYTYSFVKDGVNKIAS